MLQDSDTLNVHSIKKAASGNKKGVKGCRTQLTPLAPCCVSCFTLHGMEQPESGCHSAKRGKLLLPCCCKRNMYFGVKPKKGKKNNIQVPAHGFVGIIFFFKLTLTALTGSKSQI